MSTKGLNLAPTSTPAQVSAFDYQFFDHVTMSDLALQREVLMLFRAQINEAITAIPLMTLADDWRHMLHRLKGAALAVGANAIAACAQRWENRMPIELIDAGYAREEIELLGRDFFAEAKFIN